MTLDYSLALTLMFVLECGEAGKEPASEAFGDANAEHQKQEMSGSVLS